MAEPWLCGAILKVLRCPLTASLTCTLGTPGAMRRKAGAAETPKKVKQHARPACFCWLVSVRTLGSSHRASSNALMVRRQHVQHSFLSKVLTSKLRPNGMALGRLLLWGQLTG